MRKGGIRQTTYVQGLVGGKSEVALRRARQRKGAPFKAKRILKERGGGTREPLDVTRPGTINKKKLCFTNGKKEKHRRNAERGRGNGIVV